MRIAAVLLALEAVAAAQPQLEAHDMAVRMTTAAHDAAAHGACGHIAELGRRVRALDGAYMIRCSRPTS